MYLTFLFSANGNGVTPSKHFSFAAMSSFYKWYSLETGNRFLLSQHQLPFEVVWKICLPAMTWSFTAVTRHYSFFHPRQISVDVFNMILLIGLFEMYSVFLIFVNILDCYNKWVYIRFLYIPTFDFIKCNHNAKTFFGKYTIQLLMITKLLKIVYVLQTFFQTP